MSLPIAALELFRHQHGLLARIQARQHLSPAERRVLYRDPDVLPVSTRVLRHRAVPKTLGSMLGAAVLDALPDACLWERSAALWWGFGRDRDRPVHVASRHAPFADAIGRVHHIADLDDDDVVVHDGLPVARPERVLLSLAATETEKYRPSRLHDRRHGEDLILLGPAIHHIGGVVDHAWSLGLVDGDFVHAMVDRLAERGRSGIVVLREVLRKRPPGHVPTESALERRYELVIDDLADDFERQVEISDEDGVIGRVDYRHRRRKLVVEINGELNHVTLTDRARDERRYERLLATGHSVVVFWQYDVWQRGRLVERILRSILREPDGPPTLHRPTPAPWELLPAEQRAA